MTKLSEYLAGYKTKILAFAGAVINLFQVFDITNMTQDQNYSYQHCISSWNRISYQRYCCKDLVNKNMAREADNQQDTKIAVIKSKMDNMKRAKRKGA